MKPARAAAARAPAAPTACRTLKAPEVVLGSLAEPEPEGVPLPPDALGGGVTWEG